MIFNPGLVPQASGGGGAVVGTYTGDGTPNQVGTYSQRIEVGFRICALILTAGKTIDIPDTSTSSVHPALITTTMGTDYLEVDNTGFTIKSTCIRSNKQYYNTGFNWAGTTYYYVAIPAV